jgi:hypothetical protein
MNMSGARRYWVVVAVVVSLAGTAHAQTVNWNYAQGGWATFDPDQGSSEDGWFVGGAFALGKIPIHVLGDFGDFGDFDVWQVGAGWHGLLGQRADLFADGSFYDIDVDDGFKVRFGVRWMVTQRFELDGYLAWADLDFSDNASAAVALLFDFTKRFGVGGAIDWGDEFSTGRVFVRFNFGKRS